jgi:uncharacterized membrane protein YkoI
VKVVYVTLAILMGGGLVFFGIGGDVNGGLFDAISGSSSGSSSGQATTTDRSGDADRRHRGHGQRSDETPLTGDTAEKVRAAALAELPGATIERVETDADGHAEYEAHVVKADGTRATVYVDEDFDVVSVESR